MGNRADSSATRATFASGKPRVPCIGSGVLPGNIASIVGDYLSAGDRNYVETALTGVQSITLCLSQKVKSQLASCWSLGFLPREQQWEPADAKVDVQFGIKNYKRCLLFLDQTNSHYCRTTVDVLVVKLSLTSRHSRKTLVDLRKAIDALRYHLTSVKYVVISMSEYASCCFTLKDPCHTETRVRQPVDQRQVLFDIIGDLDSCWEINKRLGASELFSFFFESKIRRASEKHLAKFIISMNHRVAHALFKKQETHTVSDKIMWIFPLESNADFYYFDQDTARRCQAIHFDVSNKKDPALLKIGDRLEYAFCYRENTCIERIVINSHRYGRALQLPRPTTPLTDASPLSALMELTLEGDFNTLDLAQLNNGYFPHLAHLSVVGGVISNHLDSRCVPRLKTLRLELESQLDPSYSMVGALVRERCQSLIRSGHPWQLVAAKAPGGWSLATFDEPIGNPREDAKEDSSPPPSHSLPLIKNLLLVLSTQQNADEFQSRLKGDLPLEAVAGDPSDRSLVWAPERVQRITVFNTCSWIKPQMHFKKAIPSLTRILTSLACHNVHLVLNGATLPHLQLLETKCCHVTLSGAFPHLQTLSFQEAALLSPWQLNAPLLQTLRCHQLINGADLSFRPHWMPHLASLQIVPWRESRDEAPEILVDEESEGVSRVQRVVFDYEMTKSFSFSRYQVHHVSHLELTVNPWKLPQCWFNKVWRCETLTIKIHELTPESIILWKMPDTVVLPRLPRVTTLVVIDDLSCVLLDTEMPNLIDCTVTSPRSLGRKLKCPALKRIRYTGQLSASDTKKALNAATYRAMGARPREVIFAFDYQMHTLTWDIVQNESTAQPLVRPLENGGSSSALPE